MTGLAGVDGRPLVVDDGKGLLDEVLKRWKRISSFFPSEEPLLVMSLPLCLSFPRRKEEDALSKCSEGLRV